MANEDSFINEVTEEVRRDRLYALMRRYGWIAVLAVIVIVGGASWNEWRKAQSRAVAEAKGDALISALQAESPEARASALAEVEANDDPSGQAILGLLQAAAALEADDPDKAATALDAVSENNDIPAVYRDVARLKRVMTAGDSLSPDDKIARLEPLLPPGNPFRLLDRAQPLRLPAAVRNTSWTHPGGNERHQQSHVALDRSLLLAWSAPIGQGNGRKHRITADPVVANGRIFTMDSRARVTAFGTNGAVVWTTDLTPISEQSDEISGGGLAVSGGRVYVTSGAGRLTALDARSGGEVWTQDLDATPTAAPTVSDGVVYLTAGNAVGWAIAADTGRILWQSLGATSDRFSTSGPSPVLAGPLVVFPFASGQMVSAVANTGQPAWAASIAGARLGSAYGALTDLTGGPIFANDVIYAATQSGKAGAFNATTGQVIWRADEGALGPLWLSGNALFFVSDQNRLLRLDAATGETVWSQNLPFFTRERIRRRKSIFAHHGPILAGGRLLLASDDGALRQFDPSTGALAGTVSLPSGAARNPVVAGGTLYIVTENGQLLAYR